MGLFIGYFVLRRNRYAIIPTATKGTTTIGAGISAAHDEPSPIRSGTVSAMGTVVSG
jgi:hypothetical protein